MLAAQDMLDLEPKCWHLHSPKISTAGEEKNSTSVLAVLVAVCISVPAVALGADSAISACLWSAEHTFAHWCNMPGPGFCSKYGTFSLPFTFYFWQNFKLWCKMLITLKEPHQCWHLAGLALCCQVWPRCPF